MEYEIISTGSQGNAVVVNNNILIDVGVSFKALKNVSPTTFPKIVCFLSNHEHLSIVIKN